MSTLGDAFTGILKALKPDLTPKGFRRTGGTFRRILQPGLVQIVNVQRSPWNHGANGELALNLAVFNRALFENLDWDFAVKDSKEKESDCIIRTRAAELKDGSDKWTAYEAASENSTAVDEIRSQLPVAFQWLDENLDLLRAVKFWESNDYHFIAAAMYYTAGSQEKARDLIRRGIEALGDRPDLRNKLIAWKEKRRL